MTKITQCEKCDHWKPQKGWLWSGKRYVAQTLFYCELTGYRSKDGWKKGECLGFMMIKEQVSLGEFIK